MAGLAAFTLGAFMLRRRCPEASFGLAWFLIALVPVSGVLPIRHAMAARFLYLPMLGWAIAASRLLPAIPSSARARLDRLALLFLVLFLGVFAALRNMTFADNRVFWNEIAEHSPNNGVVRLVVAGQFLERGDYAKAIPEFEKALKFGGEAAWAHHGLGFCLLKTGRALEAVIHLDQAVRLNPSDLDARLRYGTALAESGRYLESERVFTELLAVSPDHRAALNNLGVTYARMGRFDRARVYWERILAMEPGNRAVRAQLAELDAQKVY
jgi:Tfp pilus assembly protein PilF